MAQVLSALVRKLERESGLSREEKEAVLALPVTVRIVAAGHDIVREGDRSTQCCIVVDGWLAPYKLLEDGSRQILAFDIPGDTPDLQSLHLKSMDHSLAALIPSSVALIAHEAVHSLIARFPRIGSLLWRDTLIDAAMFRERIVSMGRKEAPARIAHLFCELFVRLRAVGLTKGNKSPMPLTQTVIGDALGMSAVHVNRSIMHLREIELITLESHTLQIIEWDRIATFAGFDPHYCTYRKSSLPRRRFASRSKRCQARGGETARSDPRSRRRLRQGGRPALRRDVSSDPSPGRNSKSCQPG